MHIWYTEFLFCQVSFYKYCMRYIEFIVEGYPEAITDFTAQSGDKNIVQTTINAYKTLVNKNQVQDNERNIDWWRKEGWDKFKKFVDEKSTQPTKTQVKRKLSAGQSILLKETDTWLIVVPLDHDSSCFHGKNTEWCTARPTGHYFDQYFLDNEVNLIYVLNKETGGKWAIASHVKINQIELFDQQDKSMSEATFKAQTGFDPRDLIKLIPDNDSRIATARTDRKSLLAEVISALEEWKKTDLSRDTKLEELLIKSKHASSCVKYVELVGDNHGPQEFPEVIQLAAVRTAGYMITYIKNPKLPVQIAAVKQDGSAIEYIISAGITPDEKVQYVAVTQNYNAIQYIIQAKITPSEPVQIAAVTQNYNAIEYIIKAKITPSEPVQIAAVTQSSVTQSWYAIEDIIDAGIEPSEAVQLAAVTQSWYAIQYIIGAKITSSDGKHIKIIPSDPVQLVAVKQNGEAIRYIIDAGIEPSESVQLAAVKQNSSAIQYIINAGIEPNEPVQLAAVKRNPSLFQYIIKAKIEPNDGKHTKIKPSEPVQIAAVTQKGGLIGDIIEAGIKPSEPVQIAAVTKNGDAIIDIIDAGIEPSEAVQLAAVTQYGLVIIYIIKAKIKPSEPVQLAAVKQKGLAIHSIIKAKIKPSEEVQLAAVTQNGDAIEYIIKANLNADNPEFMAKLKQIAGVE